jgi:hypothetical protein
MCKEKQKKVHSFYIIYLLHIVTNSHAIRNLIRIINVHTIIYVMFVYMCSYYSSLERFMFCNDMSLVYDLVIQMRWMNECCVCMLSYYIHF